jgi:hypothetical protein
VPSTWKKEIIIYSDSMTINGETFLSFLKIIHSKSPRCYLLMNKASPYYRSKKVRKYFEENKDTPYLPIFQLHHHRVYGYGRSMEYS